MKHLLCFGLLAIALGASGQHWGRMGLGAIPPGQPSSLTTDSLGGRLLVGGAFLRIRNETDTVLVVGRAAWDGSRWDSLGHRFGPISGNVAPQAYWFVRYNNELFTSGAGNFNVEPDTGNHSFARLNETTLRWEPLECLNPPTSGLSTIVPRIPSQHLFMTGFPTGLCGYQPSSVFRYDGSAFYEWPPFHQLPVHANNYVGFVFEYRGMMYMSGMYRDPYSTGWCSLMRHDGTSWQYVPGWGDQLGAVKDLTIRNDTLWLAGTFHTNEGPGNCVAWFDGTNWGDLGGGLVLQVAPQYSAAQTLEWFNDELYVGGQFTSAGGIDVNGFAKWNGHQWCSMPGFSTVNPATVTQVADIAVWRDSLYITGGFLELEGEPMNQLAQWLGGTDVIECSDPVSIVETSTFVDPFIVAPNPARDQVTFTTTEPAQIAVYDALARTFWGGRVVSRTTIDISSWPPGLYIVRGRNTTTKLIVAH